MLTVSRWGLCTTLYPDSLVHLPALVRLFLRNPHINFLFATHAVMIPELVAQVRAEKGAAPPACGTTNGMVMADMRRFFGVDPYAYVSPATPTADGELPCITYSIPVAHGATPSLLRMDSGAADRFLVKLIRRLTGRYFYFTPNVFLANVFQISINGICSGHPLRAARFLLNAIGSPLRVKRMVFENAPRITPQGTVNCCEFCPNATVRDGGVIPVCLADHVHLLGLNG